MPRKNRNNMKRKSRGNKRTLSLARLTDAPAFPGEPRVRLVLPAPPILLTTTVTTGVIATPITLDPTQILGWTARYQNTFDSYRLLKAVMRIRPLTVTTGVTRFWFEPGTATDAGATPTANQSVDNLGRTLANTQADSKSTTSMTYKSSTVQEFQFTKLNAVAPVAPNLNIYTDAANWGAPVVVTTTWLVEPIYTVEFKGQSAN